MATHPLQSFAVGILALAVGGCSGSNDSTFGPIMAEAQHNHYHVHAVDASHEHTHPDLDAFGGHTHSHTHSHTDIPM